MYCTYDWCNCNDVSWLDVDNRILIETQLAEVTAYHSLLNDYLKLTLVLNLPFQIYLICALHLRFLFHVSIVAISTHNFYLSSYTFITSWMWKNHIEITRKWIGQMASFSFSWLYYQ